MEKQMITGEKPHKRHTDSMFRSTYVDKLTSEAVQDWADEHNLNFKLALAILVQWGLKYHKTHMIVLYLKDHPEATKNQIVKHFFPDGPERPVKIPKSFYY